MKRTRDNNLKKYSQIPKNDEELRSLHQHCVSIGFMKMSYLRSPDFDVCDEDGTENPIGEYVRSKRTGKIKPIGGQCSLEFLPDGNPNPDWNGCPFATGKMHVLNPPSLAAVEKYLDESDQPQAPSDDTLRKNVNRLNDLLKKVKV